jgi:GNAT superfamily N-acetyltransferase
LYVFPFSLYAVSRCEVFLLRKMHADDQAGTQCDMNADFSCASPFFPVAWFAPLVRTILSFKNWLLKPSLEMDPKPYYVFKRELPKFLTTQRRKSAYYLSTVAIDPKLQGRGLGGLLVQDGLNQADAVGAAAWLCRVENLGPYYEKYGFREVGSVSVEELSAWEGGQVMFRE